MKLESKSKSLTVGIIAIVILLGALTLYNVGLTSGTVSFYYVNFKETGLDAGTRWTVSFNGGTFQSTTDTITVWGIGYFSNRAYTFNSVDGYSQNATSGTVTCQDSNPVTVYVKYTSTRSQLTMIVDGQGTVTPGNSTHNKGASVDLEAVAADGWTFSGWSGDASGSSNTTITMDTNKAVTATFTQDTCYVNVFTIGQGTVRFKDITNHTFHYGNYVILQAMPEAGWSFNGWSGDITNRSPQLFVDITGNVTLTVTFIENTYTVTTITVGQGTTLPLNTTTYRYNDTVSLEAYSASGWSFTDWTGHIIAGATNTTVQITSNLTVTATFTQDTYTLTMLTVGSGSVLPGNQSYLSGTSIDIKAVNNAGWSFSGWTGDATGSTNTTITMNGNLIVTATFTQDTYTLTMLTIGTGSVSPGNQSYLSGSNVDIKALVGAGWHFSGWSGDATGTTNTTITMTSNLTVTATFTQDIYTLTIVTVGGGSVLPGNQSYLSGASVDLKAINSLGWSFSGWSGDTTGTTNTTITLDSNKTVTATFLENTYILTMLTAGNGNVNPGNVTTYHYGDTVNIQAINAPGWTFSAWSGDATGTTNTTITMDTNKTVTATFTENIPPDFQLNIVPSEGGTTTPATGSYTYSLFEVAQVTANPNSGYSFAYWIVDDRNYGNNASLTISMYSTHNIQAVFVKNTYTLTVLTQGQGTVTVTPSNSSYTYGEKVTLQATAAEGWSFAGWSGDATGTTSTTITVDGNKVVSAIFTQNSYSLTVITVGHGTVNAATQTVLSGTTIYLTATPADGWSFAGWSGDATGTTNAIITMNSDKTVTATFTPNTYTLTIITVGQGTVTPSNHTYTYGETIDLKATAANGWTFNGWSGDATGTADTNILINADKTVTATFTKIPAPTYPMTVVSGNISKSQFTDMTVTTDPESNISVVTFSVSGPSGTYGTCTLAIPKTIVPDGNFALFIIDGVPYENVMWSSDDSYYYVIFSTHFSTHEITIEFSKTQTATIVTSTDTPKPTVTPTPTPTPTTTPTTTPTPTVTPTPTPSATATPTATPTSTPTPTPTTSPTTQPTATTQPTTTSNLTLPIAGIVILLVIVLVGLVVRNKKQKA